MRDAGCLQTYVPVDISEEITQQTAELLVEEYPGLDVRGLVCDFEHHLERIPDAGERRLIAFLGGTIGNLYPYQRRSLHVPDRGADVPRRPLPARHRPDQGPGAARGGLRRRRGSDGRVQQERARGPQPRARRRLRPRRLRPRRPLRRATRSGWTSGCARSPTSACGSTGSTSRSSSPPARSCAPRSRPSSPASASRRSTPTPGSSSAAGSPTRRATTRSASRVDRIAHRDLTVRRRLWRQLVIKSPSLSGVVIGVRIGRVTPPSTNRPSRSFISSGEPKMNMSSISSQGAAAAAPWRSPDSQAETIGVDLLAVAEPAVEGGVDRDRDVGGEHEPGERLDRLALAGDAEEAAEQLEALGRVLELRGDLGQARPGAGSW